MFFSRCMFCLTLFAGALVTVPAASEETGEGAAPAPCSGAQYRQFDFWVGDWKVTNPDGELEGHNTVERILDGCALKESWRGAQGSRGYSFNTFDRMNGHWHQTWVDGDGLLLRLNGGLEDGSMVLRGNMPAPDGGEARTRITWTPRDDGTVRQHWEASRDGGETWDTVFDGLYVPAGR